MPSGIPSAWREMGREASKPRRRRRLLVGGAALLTWISALSPVGAVPCPKLCSGHGRCDTGNRQCVCYDSWYGADCSLARCPYGHAWADVAQGTDDAHNMAECSNRGLCDTTFGTCACQKGFEGQACERKTCPNQCNGHGRCQSMSYFSSLKNPGEGTVYSYKNVWDAEMLYGCNCDDGYLGPDCSLKSCPSGDDPFTGTAINPSAQQYNEKQQVVCVATGGSFTLSFRGETTGRIPWDASAAKVKAALQSLSTISAQYYDAVAVTFVGVQTKACTIAGTTIQIEFLQDFGLLPLMLGDGSRLTHSYSQLTPSLSITRIVQGTKENEWCSNRGLCDLQTGVCNCMTSYDTSNGYGRPGQRGDCGYAVASITNCPGEIACSGHGVCAGYPTYRCECSKGWTGSDCSEMTCPYGRSWFSLPTANDVAHLDKAECSDMGVCDRTYGVCGCMEGFEGAACERLKCPGDPVCSDNGKCMTLALLAKHNTTNGVLTPYTYGSIPNDAAVWDYDKLQGCMCDEGFTGYDCSLRTCPSGDDPMTDGQVDEVQDLYCEDDGDGYLKLTFREATTTTIAASASVATLQAALEALPTVQKVEVLNLNSTDAVCSVGGQLLRISFLVAHGDLPLLELTTSYITAAHVKEFLKGTKEVLECSGRGLCDHGTGLCSCFTGFTSSDGMGGPGTQGDCGYADPIIAPEYVQDAVAELTTQL